MKRALLPHPAPLLACFSAIVLSTTIAGCQSKGTPTPAPGSGGTAPDAQQSNTEATANPSSTTNPVVAAAGWWSPAVKHVYWYPGTRWIQSEGRPVISTALELRDVMGDPIKTAGTLRIEWIKPSLARQNDIVLNQWTVDLKTLADQKAHWSPILRSYTFDLTVNNANEGNKKTLLTATYIPPDPNDQVVRAEFELKKR